MWNNILHCGEESKVVEIPNIPHNVGIIPWKANIVGKCPKYTSQSYIVGKFFCGYHPTLWGRILLWGLIKNSPQCRFESLKNPSLWGSLFFRLKSLCYSLYEWNIIHCGEFLKLLWVQTLPHNAGYNLHEQFPTL